MPPTCGVDAIGTVVEASAPAPLLQLMASQKVVCAHSCLLDEIKELVIERNLQCFRCARAVPRCVTRTVTDLEREEVGSGGGFPLQHHTKNCALRNGILVSWIAIYRAVDGKL